MPAAVAAVCRLHYENCIKATGQIARTDMTPGAQAARAMERSCIFIIEADDVIRSALQFMLLGDNEVHTMASLERAQASAVPQEVINP